MDHAEYIQKRQSEAVLIAKKILAEEINFMIACRNLSAILHEVYEENIPKELRIFILIDSETDALPVGQERENWNESALKEKDKEIAEIYSFYEEKLKNDCRDLIECLSTNIQKGNFRRMTFAESAVLQRLFQEDFHGKEEVEEQIKDCLVKTIDENGSLRFHTASKTQAKVLGRIPIEGYVRDKDGIMIHILLHVVDGRLDELEFFKEDNSKIVGITGVDKMSIFNPSALPPLEDLKGKSVIIGATIKKIGSEEVEYYQFFAEIVDSSKEKGVLINRKDNGGKYVFPPDLSFFKRALPGTYRFKTTGEEVVNPDLLMTLVMDAPDIKFSIRHFEGKKLFSAIVSAKGGSRSEYPNKNYGIMILTFSMSEEEARKEMSAKLEEMDLTYVSISGFNWQPKPPPADSNPLLIGAYQRALNDGLSTFVTIKEDDPKK